MRPERLGSTDTKSSGLQGDLGVLFRVTLRARDWLKKADPNLLLDLYDQTEGEREWYCNLLFIHRRKCLLFAHSATLFSFLALDVRVADLQNFGSLFRTRATKAFAAEGITPTQMIYLLDPGPDHMAKAVNRSVIGSMTDLARLWKSYAAVVGNLELTDVIELNHEINRVPMSYLAMASGCRCAQEILGSERS